MTLFLAVSGTRRVFFPFGIGSWNDQLLSVCLSIICLPIYLFVCLFNVCLQMGTQEAVEGTEERSCGTEEESFPQQDGDKRCLNAVYCLSLF